MEVKEGVRYVSRWYNMDVNVYVDMDMDIDLLVYQVPVFYASGPRSSIAAAANG